MALKPKLFNMTKMSIVCKLGKAIKIYGTLYI
jgi:hypothetical protein